MSPGYSWPRGQEARSPNGLWRPEVAFKPVGKEPRRWIHPWWIHPWIYPIFSIP